MIKILLVGCNGKMGRMISSIVEKFEDLTIAAGIDINTVSTFGYPIFNSILKCDKDIDVILDFSRPDSFDEISTYAVKNNKPVIFCTTGHSIEQVSMIKALREYVPVFFSANMSIGVNVINNVLKQLSNVLYKDFDIEIIEKHHNQKVDSPSGTALLLANTIKNSIEEETFFIHGREGISKRHHKEIGIHAIRGGNIIGDHEVIFAGQGEVIEIKHSAISREVFAVGALRACSFIYGKPKGLYSMEDVVKL
jgi:4-hydroxy-tetrahydrodipicolinate reductase